MSPSQRSAAVVVLAASCELLGDFQALARFHSAAQHGCFASGIAEPAGDRIQVVYPGGKDEDVCALAVCRQHVGDDLVQAMPVSDERAVDFGHPHPARRVRVARVAELGWVDMQDRVRCGRIRCSGGECPRTRRFQGVTVRSELMVDQVLEPVSPLRRRGQAEPILRWYPVQDGGERGGGDVVTFVDDYEPVAGGDFFDIFVLGECR